MKIIDGIKNYSRICKRCHEMYWTTAKHGSVCGDCNKSNAYLNKIRRLKI